MPLHKPHGLRQYPKRGGNKPLASTDHVPLKMQGNWKSSLSPRVRIEFEIAGLRQRVFDIERIRENPEKNGVVYNAQLRRNWHRGTKAKIALVLALIQEFSGDQNGFLEELKEIEQQAFAN